jgi:hypothetical protein
MHEGMALPGDGRNLWGDDMVDLSTAREFSSGRVNMVYRSRADLLLKWLLRFLLPLAGSLGVLLFYLIFVDNDECVFCLKLISAVPLTIMCGAVALWAWEVWQPTKLKDRNTREQ